MHLWVAQSCVGRWQMSMHAYPVGRASGRLKRFVLYQHEVYRVLMMWSAGR